MPATPITNPVSGESLVGTEPQLSRQVDPGWRRRLNLFSGRALSDTALDNEQRYRAGLLATLGQSVTPGTVRGLALTLDTSGAEPVLTVSPGYGIAATGEDLALNATLKTALSTLAVLDAATGNPLIDPATESPLGFKQFAAEAGNTNYAGILLLQSVVAQVSGQSIDTGSQPIEVTGSEGASCDPDPEEYAFEDWQIVDGVRLAFLPWPAGTASLALPALNPEATLRSRFACEIFQAEAAFGPEDQFPWCLLGVPVALIAFDTTWKPLFVDCSAVVRAGGLPRSRWVLPAQRPPAAQGPAIAPPIQPGAAQARFNQLSEQLGQTLAQAIKFNTLADLFPLLPPSGILPATALDFAGKKAPWFPPNWSLTAAPVYLEELEAVLRTGMGKAPIAALTAAPTDPTLLEPVEILIPLPDSVYDPDILVTETVAPIFQQEIDAATQARNGTLQQLRALQQELNALSAVVTPQNSAPNQIDPDAGLSPQEVAGRNALPPYTPSPAQAFGTLLPTTWLPLAAYTVGQFAVDASGAVQVVLTAGASGGGAPAWNTNVAGTTQDGGVVWLNNGGWAWQPNTAYIPGQFAIDPNGFMQVVKTGGTSAAAPPAWNEAAGGNTSDGASVTWTNNGLATWQKDKAYGANQIIIDASGSLQYARNAGASGNAAPAWSPAPASLTTDNNITWVNLAFSSTDVAQLKAVAAQAPYTTTSKDSAGTSHNLTLLNAADQATLNAGCLPALIASLNAKISQANDLLDLAFLTVQTDIYRYRQNVLGSTAATSLATSPVLANIATGVTAAATASDLQQYLSALTPPATSAAAGAAAPAAPVPVFQKPVFTSLRLPVSQVSAPAPAAAAATPRLNIDLRSTALRSTAIRESLDTVQASPTAPAAPAASFTNRDLSALGGLQQQAPAMDTAIGARSAIAGTASLAQVIAPVQSVSTAEDITSQSPLVGAQLNVRTLTIAERMQQSPSQEAMFYSIGNRLNFLQLLQALENGLNIVADDLPILVDGTPPAPPAAGAAPAAVPVETHTFSEWLAPATQPAILGKIQAPYLTADSSEATLFSVGIRVAEQHTMLLRALEGRVQQYADFVALCASALNNVQSNIQQAQAGVTQVRNTLLEDRQNVAFTTALLGDETARVQAVNAQRLGILQDSVQLVAYTRARTLDATDPTPSRQLVPANIASPVPACLQQTASIPPELREIVSLLREAPLTWLPAAATQVTFLDRPILLLQLAQSTQARAALQLQTAPLPSSAAGEPGAYAGAISGVFTANQQVFRDMQSQRAALQPAALTTLSWGLRVAAVQGFAAISDLVASDAVHSEIASRVSRLVQQVSGVATCLYTRASIALPVNCLAWAEYLSGQGASTPLQSLANLPNWNQLAYVDRQQMQLLVDWLFQQIDTGNSAAVAYMSDVVRTAILLASDVPIDNVIPGNIILRTQPAVGGIVSLNLPSDRVSSGMFVHLYSGATLAARAVVSDLDASTVSATVTDVFAPGLSLDAGDTAHFTAQTPQAVAMRPLMGQN